MSFIETELQAHHKHLRVGEGMEAGLEDEDGGKKITKTYPLTR